MHTIYENIKALRQQHHMSQSDLAAKVGYADKTMISRIENGKIDLPQSQVVKFAEVFHVTPGYLMGWEDNKTLGVMSEYSCKLNINNQQIVIHIEPMVSYGDEKFEPTPKEIIEIMHYLTKLNDKGIDDVVKHLRLMVNSGEYNKEE